MHAAKNRSVYEAIPSTPQRRPKTEALRLSISVPNPHNRHPGGEVGVGRGAERLAADFEDFEVGLAAGDDGLEGVAGVAARVGFTSFGIAVVGAAGEADPVAARREPFGHLASEGGAARLVECGPDAAVEGEVEWSVGGFLEKVRAAEFKFAVQAGGQASGLVDCRLRNVDAKDAVAEGGHLGGFAAEAAADIEQASAGRGVAGQQVGKRAPGLTVVPGRFAFPVPGLPMLARAAAGALFGVVRHSEALACMARR